MNHCLSSSFCLLVALQAADYIYQSLTIAGNGLSQLFLYIHSQSTTMEYFQSLWRRWWATIECKSCTSPSPRASGGRESGVIPPSPALLVLNSGLGSYQILSTYNEYCSSYLQLIYMVNSMSVGGVPDCGNAFHPYVFILISKQYFFFPSSLCLLWTWQAWIFT